MNSSAPVISTLSSLGLKYEAIGAYELPLGTLVWLSVTPSARKLLAPAALAKELQIAETGVVPRLKVRNPSKIDVLLPSDIVVDGGKQARVVERSVIVPAGLEVEIPVRCVEAGRWHPKSAATAGGFSVTAAASIDSREHLTRLKQDVFRARKSYELDQSEVWKHVASELKRSGTSSDTTSYTAFLGKRDARIARARELAIAPPASANAVAVVRHRGGVWIEAFPAQDHVEASIVGHVADLLEENASAKTSQRPFADPSARAKRAAERVWSAPATAIAPPEGTKGDGYAIDAEGIAGFVLLTSSAVAHLATSVAAQ